MHNWKNIHQNISPESLKMKRKAVALQVEPKWTRMLLSLMKASKDEDIDDLNKKILEGIVQPHTN